MSRLAIVGSRSFDDYALLKGTVDKFMTEHATVNTIVSGGAQGADTLGAKYAKECAVQLVEYLPDWKKHGRAAGMIRNGIIRNGTIIDNADYVIAFWDGSSRGTLNSISRAKKADNLYSVVKFSPK
ncbi:DUF2493 domain-containing protein [bacterium]|nr:DUF2493 domain-containing protein [bacterium]